MNCNCSNLLDMRNLQEQVKKHSVIKNCSDLSVWINCSSDLKMFENSWPSASNFKSFFSFCRSKQFSKQNTIFTMESKAKLTDNCHPFSHIIVTSPVGALNNFDPGSWKLQKTFIAVFWWCFALYFTNLPIFWLALCSY